MGINIRTKGASGEREVCKILVEHGLVNEASRNLDQVREGGGDVEALTHFSIEVKRHQNLAIKGWWDQSCASAARMGKIPCVWWRPNSKKWLVMLPKGTMGDWRYSPVNQCGAVIQKNYPHLDFVHYLDFVAWYKAKYVTEVAV